jgi:PAS domain S-box-containing protein
MSAEWESLVALNERLRPLQDAVEIQEAAVRLIGEQLRANRVHYAHIDDDEFVVVRSWVDGVPHFAPRVPLARYGEAIINACRRGQTVAVDSVLTDPRFTAAERQQLLADAVAAFVGVPLIKDGRWFATFSACSATPRTWTRADIVFVEAAAQRTWGAGERARAEEALGRSESRQSFLHRLNNAIRPIAEPARVLDESCRLLGSYLRVNRVAYGEIDGDDCVIVGEYVDGLPPQPKRFSWANLGGSRDTEILKGGTLSVNDTSTGPHTSEERQALQAAGIGAYICPVLVKGGQFVGAFGVHSCTPRVWTADEISLAEDVADRIWTTLEHRRAEAELRANEERLAFLLRLNDALRPLSDPNAVLDAAAKLVGDYLGVTRVGYVELDGRAIVGRHEYTRGVPPLSTRGMSGGFGAALRDAYASGKTVVVNDVPSDPRFTDAERISMHERQIAAFIGVTLIKDGRLVAAFGANNVTARQWTPTEIALVRDVAERTWDAVGRVRAEAALREREHRYRLALTASGGGSWTWDPRTSETDWDDAFRARFQFSPEETPSFEAWFARVHADDRAAVRYALEEILRARNTWDHTYRFVRPDGTVLWIESLGRAERDANGQVTQLTGLELDITEHRQTEEALRALRDEERNSERQRAAAALQDRTTELEHRTRQLSQMAWDLTLAEHNAREQIARTLHDGLQQLLVIAVLNLDQQLKRERDAGGTPSDLLVEAKSQLDQAVAAARSLHFELFPPVLQRSGLPAALTWLASWARDKYQLNVVIDADPNADSPRKDVRTLLFESVRELLFNAFKYARAKRVTLALRLLSDDELCVTVTDNGVGFEPAALDDRSKAGQVGWGLFSIRERLTLLGGSVDLESAPGRGTRVRLIAPRGAVLTTADGNGSRADAGVTPAGDISAASSNALRILVVDDHAAVRKTLREMLEERPELAVVGDSSNGYEAIAHAHTLRPDIVLMDIAMPHMDGIEAAARIHAELPHVQTLLMSMQAGSDTIHAIERAGAVGFFDKGIDMQRMIDYLLGVHASRVARHRANP